MPPGSAEPCSRAPQGEVGCEGREGVTADAWECLPGAKLKEFSMESQDSLRHGCLCLPHFTGGELRLREAMQIAWAHTASRSWQQAWKPGTRPCTPGSPEPMLLLLEHVGVVIPEPPSSWGKAFLPASPGPRGANV